MRTRKITRFMWDLRNIMIEVRTIPPANNLYGKDPYRLDAVEIVLFPDTRRGYVAVSAQYRSGCCLDRDLAVGAVAEFLRGHIKNCDGVVVTPFGQIRVDLSAQPGKKFTETAMDLCIDIFNSLGIKHIPAPLIGQFTQVRVGGQQCWQDFGEVLLLKRLSARERQGT